MHCIRRHDLEGTCPQLKPFYVSVWADCLTKLCRSGCAFIRKSPLFSCQFWLKTIVRKDICREFFSSGGVFFLTINFPLASWFSFDFRKFGFYCPPRRPEGTGRSYTGFFPQRLLFKFSDYDHMKNLLGKVISRGHMLEFQKSPSNFHLTHIIKITPPIQSDYYKVF